MMEDFQTNRPFVQFDKRLSVQYLSSNNYSSIMTSTPSPNAPPVIENANQKLVTIYLDNSAYAMGKTLVGTFADKHGLVEEHLGPLLANGWRVKKIDGFGGNSDGLSVRGWILVLLERDWPGTDSFAGPS